LFNHSSCSPNFAALSSSFVYSVLAFAMFSKTLALFRVIANWLWRCQSRLLLVFVSDVFIRWSWWSLRTNKNRLYLPMLFCEIIQALHLLLLGMYVIFQVMGKPPKQLITLTHRTQVKRFTHEIVKILKNSPDKAILVAQLPDMYFKWVNLDTGVAATEQDARHILAYCSELENRCCASYVSHQVNTAHYLQRLRL